MDGTTNAGTRFARVARGRACAVAGRGSSCRRVTSPHPTMIMPEFLQEAPEAVRGEFVREARAFRLPGGRQVLVPGQSCSGIALVTRGSVRVYLLGQDGREITLYRVSQGHGCVLTASCILGDTVFPASAVVETEATGFVIGAERFRAWVVVHPFWREYVFRMIGLRLATVLARFEEAAFDRLDTRLARLLMDRIPPGEGMVPATHQQLADELGSAREVVSRALGRWQTAGWVKLHRGAIQVLHGAAVTRIAGG